jgi:protein-S-isoprenylcysteine O-methyltransferase Ste14
MALQEEFEKQGNWLFRYRSILPLIIIAVALGVFAYMAWAGMLSCVWNSEYKPYYELICLLVSLLGLYIRCYTVGHTPAGTSGRNTSEGQVAESLNTTGIYSTVRHPLYLGNFLMWLGLAMLVANVWFVLAFCLVYFIYYERIMYAEEQFLRRKFGTAYTDWADGKPAFIPSFKHFVKPKYPFSWKKVLRNEKNGVAALFILFAAFDALGEYLTGRGDYNYWLLGACALSIILYFILKYLKHCTKVLNTEGR